MLSPVSAWLKLTCPGTSSVTPPRRGRCGWSGCAGRRCRTPSGRPGVARPGCPAPPPQPDRAAALVLVAEVDAERGDEAAAVEVEAQQRGGGPGPAPRTLPAGSRWENAPLAVTDLGCIENEPPPVTTTRSPLGARPKLGSSITSRTLPWVFPADRGHTGSAGARRDVRCVTLGGPLALVLGAWGQWGGVARTGWRSALQGSSYRRDAVPAARRRRSRLLLVLAAASLVLGVQLLGGLALAAPNPPGNNGTVKVDGIPFDDHPNNEPHVGCTFQVDFYGFDEGDLFADVTFESHPPTGPVQVLLTDTVFIGEDDNSGGGSEAGLDASATYTLDFTGIQPHPNQGFHVKLTVNAEGS